MVRRLPEDGEAVTHIMKPCFDRWARIEMESGGEAHLCPSCSRERGRRCTVSHREVGIHDQQWARQDSNLDLTDYESAALTD